MINVITAFKKTSNSFSMSDFTQCQTRQEILNLFITTISNRFSISGLICFPGPVIFMNHLSVLPPIVSGSFNKFLFSFEAENKLQECISKLEKMKLLSRSEFQRYMHSFLINNDCKNVQNILRLSSNRYEHGVMLIDGLKRLRKRDRQFLIEFTVFVVKCLDHSLDHDCFQYAERNLLKNIGSLRTDIQSVKSDLNKQTIRNRRKPNLRVSQLAHDIRSPLFILRNLSTQLKTEPAADTKAALNLMESSVEKINHQLAFECQTPTIMTTTKVNLRKLILDSIQLSTSALSVGSVQFKHDIEVGDRQVSHRRAYVIFRLLNNFVGNACKYTLHGSVSLTACIKHTSIPYLDLQIKDTGVGLPDAVLRYIKQLEIDIYEENLMHYGKGLGLSICQQLLVSIHGVMGVIESSIKGTHIECKVPLSGEMSSLYLEELDLSDD